MKAILERIQPRNQHIATFWFRPEKKPDYVAGQFTELHLAQTQPDDRGDNRWFTLCSSPTEDLLAITTKFARHSSTFKEQLRKLEPGDEVHLAEAMGDFVLPKDSSLPLVFVAGGIGITPFRSIITWLRDTKQKRNITLLYSVAQEEDFIFTKDLDCKGLNVIRVAATHEPTWTGLSGHLTADRILELAPARAETLYYLSGPEQMVEVFTRDLKKKGVADKKVVTDFFHGYSHL